MDQTTILVLLIVVAVIGVVAVAAILDRDRSTPPGPTRRRNSRHPPKV